MFRLFHRRNRLRTRRPDGVGTGPSAGSDGAFAALATGFLFWIGAVVIAGITADGLYRHLPAARVAGLAGLIGLVVLGAGFYIARWQWNIIDRGARCSSLAVFALGALALIRIGVLATDIRPGLLIIGVAATFAFVLALSYPPRSAFGLTVLLNVLIGLSLSDFYVAPQATAAYRPASLLGLVLLLSAGSSTASFTLSQVRTRTRLLEVGVIVGTAYAIAAAAVGLYLRGDADADFASALSLAGRDALEAFAAAVLVGMVVTALLPYIERVFGITTSISLIELSDAGHPLLRRLALEAPGTYNHSLLLGTMCEAAAGEIGADGLLARVGCYYHDIGKLTKPDYFIENQSGGPNPHDALTPAMSKLVIVSHVRDGREMAREYGLPSVLIQFIEQHHGTTLLDFFFRSAKSRCKEGDAEVDENEFRYPGPKPRTKEAAVVLFADGVEGAVRALPERTPGRIEDVVHAVGMKRLMDGQFDDAVITLAELHRIEQSFVRTLCSHHHGRIAYPASALDSGRALERMDSTLSPPAEGRPVVASAAEEART